MNTISNQILTSIAVTVALFFGGWSMLIMENTITDERDELEQNLTFVTDRLAFNLANPIWNYNFQQVQENIENEAKDENIRSIQIFDENGNLYSGIIRDGETGKIKKLSPEILKYSKSYFSEQSPYTQLITYKGKMIGKVFVYPNPIPLSNAILQLRLQFLLELVAFIFLIAGILFLILRKVVIKPLITLENWATKTEFDQKPPMPKFQSKEINSLFLAFSHLTEHLFSSLNEISEKNKQLNESQSQIKSISDNFRSGMIYQVISGPNGKRKFTYLSDSVNELYGITPQDGINDASLVYGKIHPDDVDFMTNSENRAIKNLATFKAEIRMREPSGNYRWSSFVSTPTLLENGSIQWDGIEFDITNLKQIEEELRISQKKFAVAFRSSPDGIFISEQTTGRIFEVNDAIQNIFGYTREEAIGKTSIELGLLKNSSDRQKVVDVLGQNISVQKMEIIGKHTSGSDLNLLVSVESGDIDGIPCFITTVNDITERKKTEEALRKSEERFKSIISVSNTGAWEYHSDSDYLWCSPEYFSMLGRNLSDYSMSDGNLKETWIDLLHPDDRDNAINHFAEYIQNGSIGTYENHFRMLHSDGNWKWIWSRGQTLRDENGHETNLTVGTHIDITEKKLAEIKLQNLNSDKDRFMTILGHDLRSPFNAILGLLDLLCLDIRKMETEEVEELLKLTHRSAQNAYDLLNGVLDWSLNQSGEMNFQPKKIIVAHNCLNIINVLQPISNAKNITLHFIPSNGLTVFADKNMFDTIVRNLISNAIKFTNPSGTVEISAKETAENVIISVADNGVGMSPDAIAKIFDKAELYSTTGTDNEKGTGFGLKLCQEFIEKHGGKIWVESKIGKGSTFSFSLPKQ